MKHIIIDKIPGMSFQQVMFMANYAQQILKINVKICITSPYPGMAWLFSNESITRSNISINENTAAFISLPKFIKYCYKKYPNVVFGSLKFDNKIDEFYDVLLTKNQDGYLVEDSQYNPYTDNIFSGAVADFIYRIKNKLK